MARADFILKGIVKREKERLSRRKLITFITLDLKYFHGEIQLVAVDLIRLGRKA